MATHFLPSVPPQGGDFRGRRLLWCLSLVLLQVSLAQGDRGAKGDRGSQGDTGPLMLRRVLELERERDSAMAGVRFNSGLPMHSHAQGGPGEDAGETRSAGDSASTEVGLSPGDTTQEWDSVLQRRLHPTLNPTRLPGKGARGVGGSFLDSLVKQLQERPEGGKERGRRLKEAGDFLDHYVRFPGAGTCGHWGDSYAAMHSRVRSADSPNQRYLLYVGRDGLGDRLNGLLTAFSVVLLTSRTLILGDPILPLGFAPGVVDWTVPKHLQGRQHLGQEVWAPENNNRWTIEQLIKSISNGFDAESANGSTQTEPRQEVFVRYWTALDTDLPIGTFLESFSLTSHIPLLRFSVNSGVLTQLLGNATSAAGQALRAMGLRESNAHACILRFLFRPREEVLAALPPAMVEMGIPGSNPSICIHARFNDDKAWDKKGPHLRTAVNGTDRDRLRQALTCAARLSETLSVKDGNQYEAAAGPKWLVLFNLPSAVAEAKRLYPQRVVQSRNTPSHVGLMGDKAAMIGTVQDWVLFSLCDHFIPSNSGLSKTSLAYSMHRKAVVKTDLYYPTYFWTPYSGPNCDPTTLLSLLELGQTWSRL